MKNIFNEADRNEILQRVEKLTPQSQPMWGKMNVAQMLAHCSNAAKMPTADIKTERVSFPINLLGMFFKSKILGDMPFRRNSPTAPEIKVVNERDFQAEKSNFITALKKLGQGEQAVKSDMHPFFGKMTPKEWGRINYKHADHHLSQFGV